MSQRLLALVLAAATSISHLSSIEMLDSHPAASSADSEHNRFQEPFWLNQGGALDSARKALIAQGDVRVAERLRPITDAPTARWISTSDLNDAAWIARTVSSSAARSHRIATLVAYAIPDRDCGIYSKLPTPVSSDHYRDWVRAIVRNLADRKVIMIVEPDALADIHCVNQAKQNQRIALIKYAVREFSRQGSWVYIDIGHSGWLSARKAARLLQLVGVVHATGFSLNVSNFRSTKSQLRYGTEVSKLTGHKHFVIDTSRNGIGKRPSTSCNPGGQALGSRPTMNTGSPLADAYLWVKPPGTSDGLCGGGPPAGQFWLKYALALVKRTVRSKR